jgi:predicted DCC family thiol-disulfide oxidoreductase YuxK
VTSAWEIEVFFDGDCPLCRREITMMQRLDRVGRIRFTDIAEPGFDPAARGLDRTQPELMAEIHARTPEGDWVTGVEVFRRLYSAVGFGPLVALTRPRPVDAVLRRAYDVFARNRLRWTGRSEVDACDTGTCRVDHSGAATGGGSLGATAKA